jgi:hypothetical protein
LAAAREIAARAAALAFMLTKAVVNAAAAPAGNHLPRHGATWIAGVARMATERDAAAQRDNIGDDERGQAAEEVGEE